MTTRLHWAEIIFRRFNPEYQHRWIIYEQLLSSYLTKETVWLDIGCGKNEHVAQFGDMSKTALGIDIINHPERTDAPFLLADIKKIPLATGSATLITLRMVVEHLQQIPDDFSEIRRLLSPNGHLIVLTTNSLSPIVFLPRLLPYSLKTWLIQRIFGVQDYEVFKTFHRFNSSRKMSKGIGNMSLVSLQYLEQVPFDRPILTVAFALWCHIVKPPWLKFLRSNLLAVFQKAEI